MNRRTFLKRTGFAAATPLVPAAFAERADPQADPPEPTPVPAESYTVFVPLFVAGEPAPTPEPSTEIAIPPPNGIAISATNSAMYRDRAGVIFASTRLGSDIGGLVWRVDGYVDRDNPGVATFVLNDPDNPQPTKFHANGELSIWPDGFLYYTTTEIQSLDNRTALFLVSHKVPGWTP
jgi:hypothetical protein